MNRSDKAARILTLAVLVIIATPAATAATWGKVVPIGGHIADLAFDARRNVVYLANFAARRVDVLSAATHTLLEPIRVAPNPGTLALSPDGRFLVVGHFIEPADPNQMTDLPGLTILDLDGGQRQTIALGSSPLAVAFGNGDRALVVTRKAILLLEPFTGALSSVPIAINLTTGQIPVPFATFPPEILKASTGVSGDGNVIWVIAEIASQTTLYLRYQVPTAELRLTGITSSPPLGPRVVSVNGDGSRLLAGWALTTSDIVLLAQFPYATGDFPLGGHAFDHLRDVIYAQIPVAAQSTTDGASPEGPVLELFDTDNLTVRERIRLRENLAGKAVFSADMQTLYAASQSGVTVLPVGELWRAPRVRSLQEDVFFHGSGCDNRPLVREIDIVDAGGGAVDFSLALPAQSRGIRLTASSSRTPARVRIEVDPVIFQNQKGTTAVELEIRSAGAVNIPPKVRLLINVRDPEQRGMVVNVPGKLVDLLADPARDRFYVLRQDKNLVLVFDGATYEPIAELRTGNTPLQMAITRDNRYLVVTNDNSQIANVYDLETLEPSLPIVFPPGHYPRSIAVSNRSMLAAVRSASGPHTIDIVYFEERRALTPPTLGIYKNEISADTVLASSPAGNVIFGAMADGTVLLYEAAADTVVASRKDLTALGGAYGALGDDAFFVGDHLLNGSLVPEVQLPRDTGALSGFAPAAGLVVRTTARSAGAPGVIERLELARLEFIRPTKTIEAPLTTDVLRTPPVGQIGQTILPFLRALAPLMTRQAIVSLSRSGLMVLPWDYDAAVAEPVVRSVVNSADLTPAVAPGSLITISGENLSALAQATRERPLPVTLGDACVTVDDRLIPLFRVSPAEIAAQLPYGVRGSARLVVRSPGGTSAPYTLNVLPAAPAVFRTGAAGPESGLATVLRQKNNQLVTLSNPIHPEETISIYLTGLGAVAPPVEAGQPAPADPLARAVAEPRVTLGDVGLPLSFVGLVPGEIGVYQINATIPYWAPTGMSVPLEISAGTYSTTLGVRVVK
jgi:uncharacterized protein (TIGR03437 family)